VHNDMKTSCEVYPMISIIIPVRNEERFLRQTVEALLDQDYPKSLMEILIIVADSTDNTLEIAKELHCSHESINYYNNPNCLSSSARNIGIQNAKGDIISFIDGHTYIDNNQLLKNTVKLMNTKNVSVLSRPQFLWTPYNSFIQNCIALARASIFGHGKDSTIYNRQEAYVDPSSSGATYRRNIFSAVGLYDESFDACEDVDLNYRISQAGYNSFTSMKLCVYYYPRETLKGLFMQMIRYGVGRYRLISKHPGTLSIWTLLPALFTLLLHILLLCSVSDIMWAKTLLLFGSIYLSAVTFLSVWISMHNGFKYLFVLPIVFLLIHLGLGYGLLWGAMRTIFGKEYPQ